jgi:hypothetical protein
MQGKRYLPSNLAGPATMLLLGPIALHDKAPPGIIEVSSHVSVGAKLKISKDKEERGR